jgi:hypothetical protein
MILLGISAKRRGGKTTLADILADEYGWKHYSLARELKALAMEHFGLTPEQTDGPFKEFIDLRFNKTPREILIAMGGFYRSIDKDYWVKRVKKAILATPQAQTQKAVISDVRFINEADWIKSHSGYVIRLERAVELTGEPLNDPSEMELDNYSFDIRFPESTNVDMKDLRAIAKVVDEKTSVWQALKIA